MLIFSENSQKTFTSTLKFCSEVSQAKSHFDEKHHLILEEEFQFGIQHCFYIETNTAKHFVFVLPPKPNHSDISLACRKFIFHQKKRIRGSLEIIFDFVAEGKEKQAAQYAALGLSLGFYDLGLYKNANSQPFELEINFKHSFETSILERLQEGQLLAQGKMLAMDLVNGAPNRVNPVFLAQSLLNLKTADCETTQFWNEELAAQKLFGIEAVGKGSREAAGLAVLDYCPTQYKHTLALVGKGVTFDSGGISLKERQNLQWLKSDMGGAAAVVGAMYVVLKKKLPLRVIAVLPVCENMPDGKAYRPGDVIDTHAGKTVEIEDTDAEGRIILADAISWTIEHYQPDTIIDLATLTGASVYALGYQAAALCCPEQALSNELVQASEGSAERLWPLPMWKEYEAAIASDVADIKNFGGPQAGAITAAKFIEAFTHNHSRWAHIDMASMVLSTNEFGKYRNATGYGVELLASYMDKIGAI